MVPEAEPRPAQPMFKALFVLLLCALFLALHLRHEWAVSDINQKVEWLSEYMRRTPAPTASPTAAPTHSPTPSPTHPPTLAPTPSPTPAPTNAPTPVSLVAPPLSPKHCPLPEGMVHETLKQPRIVDSKSLQFREWMNPRIPPEGYKFSIMTLFRNEAMYLPQWIEYHLMIGFEHFFLYPHECTDNWREVLQPYRQFVTIEDTSGDNPEHPAIDKFIRDHRGHTKWALISLNLDEYVVINDLKPIGEFMVDYEQFSGLAIFWQCYGTNYHHTRPDGLVLENYVMGTYPLPNNDAFKVLVKMENVIKGSGHNPFFRPPHFAVTEHYVWVPDQACCGYLVDGGPTIDRIRINHYRTKSAVDLEWRWQRGTADSRGDNTLNPQTQEDKNAWLAQWNRNDVLVCATLPLIGGLKMALNQRDIVAAGPMVSPQWFSVQRGASHCLDIRGRSLSPGAAVVLGGCIADEISQHFSWSAASQLVSHHSRLCVTDTASALTMEWCDEHDASQQWEPWDGGALRRVSGGCLTGDATIAASGCDQLWVLAPKQTSAPPPNMEDPLPAIQPRPVFTTPPHNW